jgi:hypothetical protein
MPADGQLRHQISYGVHDACRHKSEEARTSRQLPTTDVTPAWQLLMDSLLSPLLGRHSAYRDCPVVIDAPTCRTRHTEL